MIKNHVALVLTVLCGGLVEAQENQFKPGKTIPAYGKIADVPNMQALPDEAQFRVSFDLAKAAKVGELNRSIDSLARFINMHSANGVAIKDINLAAVIHGSAVKDFVNQAKYQSMTAEANDTSETSLNKNADLIKALSEQGVKFYICGQSAAYHGVKAADLLPNVNMSLSAMTAHALLQQQGYTLNPF